MTCAIILLAIVKARLIILYFMEIRFAVLLLRIALELWCVAVGASLMLILA